ncbi:Adipocyte plasma membrane-associated protein [Halotydeus destructor]|nr:Adipocyte plasma membrane-associated protein [Halotydeus destructor]
MGILVSFSRLLFEAIVVTGAIVVILGLLPTDSVFPLFPIEPKAYETANFSANLDKWNNVLGDKADLLLKGHVFGPESLAIKGDYLYTGLSDGRIVEIDLENGDLRFVARLAPNTVDDCYDGIYYRVERCGRPLGMRFDNRGYLTVLDSFYGLWRMNATTGHKKQLGLQPNDKNIPGDLRGLYNDFVFDPVDQDVVYISISTRRWGLDMIPWALNEHENSGALVALNVRSGKATKLVDGIHMTNGVEVTADKQYLLFSECTGVRISKLNLAEVRKAIAAGSGSGLKKELFADGFPGEPDNIRLHDGNILVGIPFSRAKVSLLTDYVSSVPIVRKAVARLVWSTSKALEFVSDTFDLKHLLEETIFKLKSGSIFYDVIPKASAIVVLDGVTGKTKAMLGSESLTQFLRPLWTRRLVTSTSVPLRTSSSEDSRLSMPRNFWSKRDPLFQSFSFRVQGDTYHGITFCST